MDISTLDPTRLAPTMGTVEPRSQGTTQAKDGKKSTSEKGGDSVELSQEAQAKVAELKASDAAVRAHEAAHLGAGAGLVKGGANYSYKQGPDGKRYATGGEVSIDTSVPDDPSAAIAKAQHIRAAALAPADPSGQDRQVAAQATQMESEARTALSRQNRSQGTTGRTAGAAYQAAGSSNQSAPSLDVVA